LKINLPIATTFESVAKPITACEQKGGFRRIEESVIQPHEEVQSQRRDAGRRNVLF
jgi:hypothetical protein